MRKKYAWCWIVMGAMLLLAALFLLLYNLHEDRKSGEKAEAILSELRQEISAQPEPTTEPATEFYIPTENLYAEYEETTEPPVLNDPVMELDGSQYIGIVSIPALGTELPVMQEWSYPNLRLSPCRYEGAAASGDLIIAAHNYRSHFGNIQSLNSGDQILFTDAAGLQYVYEVVQTEMVDGQDIPTMLAGAQEDWDLTLFTCTLSGQSRVTVRAVQIVPEVK